MADTTVVRDIMTKNMVMIDHDKTALEAAKIMTEKGISSLFVVKDNHPIGIVTERDFITTLLSLKGFSGGAGSTWRW